MITRNDYLIIFPSRVPGSLVLGAVPDQAEGAQAQAGLALGVFLLGSDQFVLSKAQRYPIRTTPTFHPVRVPDSLSARCQIPSVPFTNSIHTPLPLQKPASRLITPKMKSVSLLLAAAALVAAQKAEDYFPECSIDCLEDSVSAVSECTFDDACRRRCR